MRSWTVLFAVALAAAFEVAQAQTKVGDKGAKAPPGPGLTLTTAAFEDGGVIPNKYTQADPNPVSPKLEWSNMPPGTVSFVLYMHDPDVARQKTTEDMLHWILFNIPGDARSLPEAIPTDSQPSGGAVQIKNGGGVIGYRGPGAGAAGPYHHYTFELFALDTKLDLGPDATREDVMKAMNGHILAKAALTGRFHR